VSAVHRLAGWTLVVCALAGCAAPDTRPRAAAAPAVEITLLQINDSYVLEPVTAAGAAAWRDWPLR